MLLARKFEHQSEGERGLYAMAGGGGWLDFFSSRQ